MDTPTRNPNSPALVSKAQDRALATKLRRQGLTYQEIAERMNISAMTACRWVRKEIERIARVSGEDARAARQIDLDRLDLCIAKLTPLIEDGNISVIPTFLSVLDRRSKLLGLEAPTKTVQVNVDIAQLSDSQLIAEAQRLGVHFVPRLPCYQPKTEQLLKDESKSPESLPDERPAEGC